MNDARVEPSPGDADTPLRRESVPGYDLSWSWHGAMAAALIDVVTIGDNPVGRSIGRRMAIWGARRRAIQVSDWDKLASVDDGTVISVIGRASARRTLPFRVGGRRVIGVVLGFRTQTMHDSDARDGRWPLPARGRPFTEDQKIARRWTSDWVELETAHEFDIVVPSGGRVAVLVEGARIMANPRSRLRELQDEQKLLDAIHLPFGADGSDVRGFFLWDQATVEVIGVKRTRVAELGDDAAAAPHGRHPDIAMGGTLEHPALIVPGGP